MSFSEFIVDCERNENVEITHGILCSKDEVLESYVKYPYKMDTLKLFFSMTKTFSSLAIGIAYDQGLLDIDDCIEKYFIDEFPQMPDPNLKKISIRHLLTMSSGIGENTYVDLFSKKDWVRAFLSQKFPYEPGTYYRYSTHGSHMLSAIITKVSGLSLADFLNKYMFHPMEIYEAQWEHAPEGLVAGGMGLSMYPLSLAKVAQMLLNNGVYQGRRILSQDYLEMATKQQIIKHRDFAESENVYGGNGYGFQMHIGKDGCYRMDGAFGQICLICPQKERAVIVFSQKSGTKELLGIIYNRLLTEAVSIPHGTYRLQDNPLNIEQIQLVNRDGREILGFVRNGKSESLYYSLEVDTEGRIDFIKDIEEHQQEYVCSAAWKEALELTIYFTETPYVVTLRITFQGEDISFGFSINVSFNLKDFEVKGYLI